MIAKNTIKLSLQLYEPAMWQEPKLNGRHSKTIEKTALLSMGLMGTSDLKRFI